MKRIISAVLVLCALLALCAPVYAVNEEIGIAPMYAYVNTIAGTLTINSSGTAMCSGNASAFVSGGKATMTVALQQQKNGVWQSIKSWSASGTATNTGCSGSFAVYKGYNCSAGQTVFPSAHRKERLPALAAAASVNMVLMSAVLLANYRER